MKIKEITEEGIIFDDGSTLIDYHKPSWGYEHVYADWKYMVAMTEAKGNELKLANFDFFENILDSVVPIEGLGFYLVAKQGLCIRVDCYNKQNGWYSSDLELRYTSENGEEVHKDISHTVQNFIER